MARILALMVTDIGPPVIEIDPADVFNHVQPAGSHMFERTREKGEIGVEDVQPVINQHIERRSGVPAETTWRRIVSASRLIAVMRMDAAVREQDPSVDVGTVNLSTAKQVTPSTQRRTGQDRGRPYPTLRLRCWSRCPTRRFASVQRSGGRGGERRPSYRCASPHLCRYRSGS